MTNIGSTASVIVRCSQARAQRGSWEGSSLFLLASEIDVTKRFKR